MKRHLANNVKAIYNQRLNERRNWVKTCQQAITVRKGADQEAMVLAMAFGGFNIVPAPHGYLDLTIKLSEWLENNYNFFVPKPFEYRHSIPKKYGGLGDNYESCLSQICDPEQTFEEITNDFSQVMEYCKYISVQNITVITNAVVETDSLCIIGVDYGPEWADTKWDKNWKRK